MYDIKQKLKQTYGFKEVGSWLREGNCPQCQKGRGKKQLFCPPDEPYQLICNHQNSCGYREYVKSRHPEWYEEFSKVYPKTEADPKATARAYLKNRGITGEWEYEQEYYHSQALGIGSPTIRFQLSNGVWWERLIEKEEKIGRKTNFKPNSSVGGEIWQPQNKVLNPDRPIYITEAIIDAISLWESGYQAISIMSAQNTPKDEIIKQWDEAGYALIIALDNDDAGERYNINLYHKLLAKLKNGKVLGIAVPTGGKDWNDLLLKNKIIANMDKYLLEGSLLLAETPQDYAIKYHEYHKILSFVFCYQNETYFAENFSNIVGSDEIKCIITKILNCQLKLLYIEKHRQAEEILYFFQVIKNKKKSKITLTGEALHSNKSFKKSLLNKIAGAIFTGSDTHMGRLLEHKNILPNYLDPLEVEKIDFIGYDPATKIFIGENASIYDGKFYEKNSSDFFQVAKNSIKTTASIDGGLNLTQTKLNTWWAKDFYSIHEEKGIVALAWWIGSLFATQIRAKTHWFPFMEFYGDPNAGKSTMITFFQKLIGRNYEGYNPNNTTWTGVAREFDKYSNIPIVLKEGDKSLGRYKGFDYDGTKDFYDKDAVLKIVGMKTGGNDTRILKFKSTLLFAQNNPIEADPALYQRIIWLKFSDKENTIEKSKLLDKLKAYEEDDITSYVVHLLKNSDDTIKKLLGLFEYYKDFFRNTDLKIDRVRNNHALIMSFVEFIIASLKLTEIDGDIKGKMLTYLHKIAKNTERRIDQEDPQIEQFYELLSYLGEGEVNHYSPNSRSGHLAINFPHLVEKLASKGHRINDLTILQSKLKSCKTMKFINSNVVVNSKLTNKAEKCWCFSDYKKIFVEKKEGNWYEN